MVGAKRERQRIRGAEQIVIDFSEYKGRKGTGLDQQKLEYVSILSNQIQMMEPVDCDERKGMVESLRNGNTLILNFSRIEFNKKQKVMDFLCGACYVLNGSIYQISNDIYVVGFSNVSFGEK